MNGVISEVSKRESPYLHGRIERGQVFVQVSPSIKIGYSKQFNYIRALREGIDEPLRTEIVPENYTVTQFVEDCFRLHALYNNL